MWSHIQQRPTASALALLTAVVFAVYGQTVTFDFTNWDDPWLIIDNPFIRNWDLISLYQIWNPFFYRQELGAEYLPLREMSYSLDVHLWGYHPAGYHLHNGLLYAAMVGALFCFLRRLTGNYRLALVASLIYAVHPLHVESVAWLSARKDPLSGFFFFLALDRYVCSLQEDGRGYWPAWFAFLGAVLSKYTALCLPGMLVLSYLYVRKDPPLEGLKRALLHIWPFILLMIAVAGLAVYVGRIHGVSRPDDHFPLFRRICTMSGVVVDYLAMLVWPLELTALYYVPKVGWSPRVAVNLAVIAFVLGIGLYRFWKKRHLDGLAILIFFVCLVPVSNIIPSPAIKTDRYLLIPSLGYCILLAWGWERLMASRKVTEKTGQVILVGVLVFYTSITLVQSRIWVNSETLWTQVMNRNPQSTIAPANLAQYYLERGDKKRGKALLRVVLERNPSDHVTHYNLGVLEMEGENWNRAVYSFSMAVQYSPTNVGAHQKLGEAFEKTGDYQRAERCYRRALQIYPLHGPSRLALARLLAAKGAIGEARDQLRKALEIPAARAEAAQMLRRLR